MNVLLVVADELSVRLGCYGYYVRTPNIDRLARMGRRFERAYCQYPLGGASRTSLMTGWRPERMRVWIDQEPARKQLGGAVPLQERFHAHSYFTARVGKIYGEGREQEFSWDSAEEPLDARRGGPVDLAAARVAQLIAQHEGEPFFIAAGFARPFPGWSPPQAFLSMYPPESVARAEMPAEGWGDIPDIAIARHADRLRRRPGAVARPDPEPQERRRNALAAHYAYASFLDAQVGVLLEALDRGELWGSTVVALVGDRGPYLGEHGQLARDDTLFEESLRVPLIIVSPDVREPGVTSRALAEAIDLYPTLVELCGLPRPANLDGTSLGPILGDAARTVKTAVFSAATRVAGQFGRSVRTERYRYNEWPDGSEELYDHDSDPNEYANLASLAGHAKTIQELKKLLDQRPGGAALPPGSSGPGAARAGAGRLNVLLIIADDMNAQLGCYGYDVKTPAIDRLARRGRRFDRAYCQYAVCSPSRTSIMSGLRPETLALWDNFDPPRAHLGTAVPLEELFHAGGYFTARVGKVYHQTWDKQFDWDLAEDSARLPPEDTDEPAAKRRSRHRMASDIGSWWTATDLRDEDEPDGRSARRVGQLLLEHEKGPFFIALGLMKPHLPWVAPRRYFEMYAPDRIQLPAEPADARRDIPAIAVARDSVEHPRQLLDGPVEPEDPRRREAVAAYYACVSFVDAQVGVVLATLDRLGLWENTVVVLIGDHGFHLGDHGGLWRKETLFEEALRTPLIIAAPEIGRPGVPTGRVAELVDLYPTLVELCGLSRPADLDGRSLVPMLEDPDRAVNDGAFSVRFSRPPVLGRSVRTDRYRYTEWPDGSEELYDHEADPREYRNLARTPEHAGVVRELRKLLEEGYPAALPRR